MDFNLEKLLGKLLNTQKEYVFEDRENYSCAMVVVFTGSGESYLQFPSFSDVEEKFAAYTGVVREAKDRGATLMVTVNNAWTAAGEFELENCDLNETDAQRCILLTASGPGMVSCSLSLKYSFLNGDVRFDMAPQLSTEILLNLLPGWPAERHSRPN